MFKIGNSFRLLDPRMHFRFGARKFGAAVREVDLEFRLPLVEIRRLGIKYCLLAYCRIMNLK